MRLFATPIHLQYVLLLVSASLFHFSYANWLYFGLIENLPAQLPSGLHQRNVESEPIPPVCNTIGLDPVQQGICAENPATMVVVGNAARNSMVECANQFRNSRWNCSLVTDPSQPQYDVFGNVIRGGHKETAFLSAITAAGLVWEVTKACSAGNITDCGCDQLHSKYGADRESAREKWAWGGCSDNVRYGQKFSTKFLDEDKRKFHQQNNSAEILMDLHNNEVGRLAVNRSISTQCRCHGVSGSCEIKTCWRQLPKLDLIGAALKAKYEANPVQVARKASKKRLKRKERGDRKVKIFKEDLVYINKSPNYCLPNLPRGILGTSGRECNRTSSQADSCDLLCCGRGYNTFVKQVTKRCQCKFVWCCFVKCKTCDEREDVHTCK